MRDKRANQANAAFVSKEENLGLCLMVWHFFVNVKTAQHEF